MRPFTQELHREREVWGGWQIIIRYLRAFFHNFKMLWINRKKKEDKNLSYGDAVLSHWAAIFLSPFREASVRLCGVGEWWLMSSILSQPSSLVPSLFTHRHTHTRAHTHPTRGDEMKASPMATSMCRLRELERAWGQSGYKEMYLNLPGRV